MMELTAFSGQYAGGYGAEFMVMVCITDRDQVVAVAGGLKKEPLSKTISRELERVIMERETVQAAAGDKRFCIWCRMRWKGFCAGGDRADHLAKGCHRECSNIFQGPADEKWVILELKLAPDSSRFSWDVRMEN